MSAKADLYKGWAVGLLVVSAIVGFCFGFAQLMMWNDDRNDAQFKEECIAKGGEYVDFEHDSYVAVCQYNGQQFSR